MQKKERNIGILEKNMNMEPAMQDKKNNCHLQEMLPKISIAFNHKQGEKPLQRYLGVRADDREETLNKNVFRVVFRFGFTLIEMLVVVLIIAILAAIALPQYQKAVDKARAVEALVLMDSLQKGVDYYLLEHGTPSDVTDSARMVNTILQNNLIIGRGNLQADEEGDLHTAQGFYPSASCMPVGYGDTCTVTLNRYDQAPYYTLESTRGFAEAGWKRTCKAEDDRAEAVCNSLKAQGITAYTCEIDRRGRKKCTLVD